MEENLKELHKLKAMLSIVKGHVEGTVNFDIDKIEEGSVNFAIISVDGDKYQVWNTDNKLWINGFPIENVNYPAMKGFLGFPTDVAHAIITYSKENKGKPFDDLGFGADMSVMGLNEVRKIVVKELYEMVGENEQAREAQISSALSLMQDLQGSVNKISEQQELRGTNPEVDMHLTEAIAHINKAIETYLNTLPSDIKADVIERLGEINIDK